MPNSNSFVGETKFIYYIDEEETPYLVKLNIAPEKVTLGDFKNALNRPHSKFFFKSLDDDFGVVKEEIFEDNAPLPCFNGRVISWLVTAEESIASDPGVLSPSIETNTNANNNKYPPNLDLESSNTRNECKGSSCVLQPHTTAAPADSTSANLGHGRNTGQNYDTETESVHSANQDRIAPLRNFHHYKSSGRHHYTMGGSSHLVQQANHNNSRHRHYRHLASSSTYETPSMMSSDLESTSFLDSEEESSRFSSVTGTTLSSRRYSRARRRRRRRRPPPISRASSFSSITDSTMSLNIVSVTLNMDTVNFLGISIVGQSNKSGDGGIYVGSIMKGGAVAQDGRIEPGDMILEANGISFEEMSNDDAVRTLREQVQRPGPITLVVAKCWDPNPAERYFTIPRQEPVHPIDPRAWVLHTNAMTTPDSHAQGGDPHRHVNGASMTGASSGGESSSTLSPPGLTPGMSMGTLTSGQTSMPLGTSAAAFNMAALLAASKQKQEQELQQQNLLQQRIHLSQPTCYSASNMLLPHGYTQQIAPSIVTVSSSLPEIERYSDPIPLSLSTSIPTVIRAMLQPDSGLDIRDRVWLKLTVPNAFIGSDLVDWLFRHLEGLTDRREARKYASNLLKLGYIRHIVNKLTFSEQCYYVFRDISERMSCLSLEEVDSVSEVGAHSHPNWGHNTTSTSLTVRPVANGSMPDYNSGFTGSHCIGGASREGNSSQYSTVPPMYHPPAPPLAAPIRQLIADGQNIAASANLQQPHNGSRLNDGNRDNISGYSSSTSSTSSESNHFTHEIPGHPKTRPSETSTSNHIGAQGLHHPRQQDSVLPIPRSLMQQHSQSNSNLAQTLSVNGGVPIHQSRLRPTFFPNSNDLSQQHELAASSTGSSSTSFGNPRQNVSTNISDIKQHKTQDSLHRDSMFSSKSSSSSSCTPLNASMQETRQINSHRLSHMPNHQNCVPPPPPRISTATSGFTLTSHP
ncbi:putative Dishevelled segment polarity protein DVL-3 [Schistosoma japonicum]|uniref:Putative Dishevelled segment polarity protein DVL-3 n=1 Tax=Schistosoma japonicum TaxID=6182 RepID=A0A4Z2DKF8_SCHJA|nr:Segment polarity protein dishevelled likeVL-3 [Schistosoma japonicum]KAH8868329.1 Segment polarity protein dishevelled likeVL-3 [Schistosoma japonicum]KAH8868330.1 Segment polarity protein dishevelled likeVL-3 [Schistosoma japonicum]TNN16951.1 putative Dishevelled segment polarity protein DVL-3 [Schistosoma japonicum]TNN16952.1 putative Dishevelled segment polarity protein DVL-3 [Schistosoma japonicum]